MPSRSSFSHRLFFLAFMCILVAGAIGARIVYLSVVLGPEMARQVHRITCGESVKMSYRGSIVDRNGASLATSIAASRVALRRADYRYKEGDASELAPLLGIDATELDRTLRENQHRFLWLSRSVGVDQANAIKQLGIRGIDVHRDQQRGYPQGSLAAHIVGFVGADSQGLEGVELLFDRELRGTPVSVRVCKDGQGRIFFNEDDMAGVNHGATVELTIDATLQSIVESELKRQVEQSQAAGGSTVMLDPRTGEVLAMANVPDFDPNAYQRSPVSHRRNRAVTDLFEPGSTTKPFVVAAALDSGLVAPDEQLYCENGALQIGGQTIHDHHPYGLLTVSQVIEFSSNICAAKIGARVGAETLYEYLKRFGFGSKTGIELTGDRSGTLSEPAAWRDIHLANISFGQGISVTTLQLASAFATLANDGVRMKPFIVKRVTNSDSGVLLSHRPEVVQRAVKTTVAHELTRMLEAVVSKEGTAPRAQIAGIRVAGKTGTAQKPEEGGYSTSHWMASFAGYYPAAAPRVVLAVVIDDPKGKHFGGVVAAPVFRLIAETSLDYLRIHRAPLVPLHPLHIDAELPRREVAPVGRFRGVMPDLHGLSLRAAMRAMDGCHCTLQLNGRGYIVAQEPAPGHLLQRMARVSLKLEGGTRRAR